MLAVVLSGGGANGAYEVGALDYILQCYRPDAYCGVSVGAINSAFLAQFSHGKEYAGLVELEKLWLKLDTSWIYKKWCWGLLWYLPAFWKGSVYNTEPMRNLLHKHLNVDRLRSSGKLLRITGVSLNDGECATWNEKSPDIVQGVQASSSFPIFFSPVKIKEIIYSDGGLRNITPLRSAFDLGATKIIVVTCGPQKVDFQKENNPSILEQVSRVLDIMCSEISRDDLRKAELHNELAANLGNAYDKRWVDITVVQPEKSLGDSLDFSPSKNRKLMTLGYADAKKVFEAKQSGRMKV